MRVLVVDDEVDFRDTLLEILELKGHEAFGVGSVADYFGKAASEHFDLAVIDRALTDGDGLTILRHIRETRDVPAVLVTGSNEFEAPNAHPDVTPDLWIAKPFAFQPLLEFIEQLPG